MRFKTKKDALTGWWLVLTPAGSILDGFQTKDQAKQVAADLNKKVRSGDEYDELCGFESETEYA